MGNNLESPRGHPQEMPDSLITVRRREKFVMNPEATWDQVIEVLRVADSSTPTALEEAWNVHGRNTLDDAREGFFRALVGILKVKDEQNSARTIKRKLELQKEKRTLIPEYAKSIMEIVLASGVVAMWKRAEGKKLTDPIVEQRVYEKWKTRMIELGTTEEEADWWAKKSIATTKTVQMKKGVTEDPPVGGIRAAYEIIKAEIEKQKTNPSPK